MSIAARRHVWRACSDLGSPSTCDCKLRLLAQSASHCAGSLPIPTFMIVLVCLFFHLPKFSGNLLISSCSATPCLLLSKIGGNLLSVGSPLICLVSSVKTNHYHTKNKLPFMILNPPDELQKKGCSFGNLQKNALFPAEKWHFSCRKMHVPAEKWGFRGAHGRKPQEGFRAQESRALDNLNKKLGCESVQHWWGHAERTRAELLGMLLLSQFRIGVHRGRSDTVANANANSDAPRAFVSEF